MMKDAFAGKGIPVAVCAAGFLALIQCALGADMETRLWQGRIDACAKAGDWAGALRWYQRSLELNYNQPPLWERVKTAKEQLKKAGK